MPNTSASTLPALRRNVASYLQAAASRPHAVAKTRREREFEAQAQMPVAVQAEAYPLVHTPRAAWPVHRAKPRTSKVARPAPGRKPRVLIRKLVALVWALTKGSARVVDSGARVADGVLRSFGD